MTMVGFTEKNQCRSQWQSGVCKQCHWQSDCATLIRLKSTLEMLCKGLPLLIPTPYSRYRSGFLTILFRGAILMKKNPTNMSSLWSRLCNTIWTVGCIFKVIFFNSYDLQAERVFFFFKSNL